MTKSVIQPLESYRLAQYAVPIACYICDTDNTFDAEFCTHCLAPMALAHQANSQKIRPLMIAVVGAADAGKTVYLGTCFRGSLTERSCSPAARSPSPCNRRPSRRLPGASSLPKPPTSRTAGTGSIVKYDAPNCGSRWS